MTPLEIIQKRQEEFKEKIQEVSNAELLTEVDFGYRTQEGNFIFTVVNFENVENFHKDTLLEVLQCLSVDTKLKKTTVRTNSERETYNEEAIYCAGIADALEEVETTLDSLISSIKAL